MEEPKQMVSVGFEEGTQGYKFVKEDSLRDLASEESLLEKLLMGVRFLASKVTSATSLSKSEIVQGIHALEIILFQYSIRRDDTSTLHPYRNPFFSLDFSNPEERNLVVNAARLLQDRKGTYYFNSSCEILSVSRSEALQQLHSLFMDYLRYRSRISFGNLPP